MELPHTAGCLVCGRQNPHGMRLSLHVDEVGAVRAEFVPRPEHIGFEGIIHGGVLATVLDEAMVWAATWAGKRFCVAGEMAVRFRRSAAVGQPLMVEARVASAASKRPGTPRLIHAEGRIVDGGGALIAESSGKYVPVSPERHRDVITTFVEEEQTARAAAALKEAAR